MAVQRLHSQRQGVGRHPTLPPPSGGGPGREAFTLDQVRSVLRRHLSLILTVVAIGTGLAILAGFKITREYTAIAQVVIDRSDAALLDVINEGRVGAPADSAVETEIQLITSRTLLGRVMADQGLFDDPEFNPPAGDDGTDAAASGLPEPLRTVMSVLPDSWLTAAGVADEAPAAGAAADRLTAAVATVDRVAARLDVEQAGGSQVIDISFTSRDPEKAARVANAIAEAYVSAQVERKRRAAGGAASWLADRLTELQHDVEASEKAIAEFRATAGLFNTGAADGSTLNDQKILDLNRQLVALRAEKRALEAKLARARSADAGTLSQELNSPLITTLRGEEATLQRQQAELAQTYGPRHPTMINLRAEIAGIQDKIRLEVGRGVRALADDLQVLDNQEQVIAQDLEGLKQEDAVEGQAEVRLRELERQAEANRQLYETFLRRYKEAQEQEQIIAPDARVITVAEMPERPVTPGPRVFALVGFTLSLMLGSFLAFLVEGLDRRVRSSSELEREFGVGVLGVLPLISGREAQLRPAGYVAERPFSGFAEAARSIITGLRMADQSGASVLLVTSALPEEGKTTLSISLAAGAANSGLKVLLIDLDLRRPTLHERLGAGPGQPGLVDHLNGSLPRERLIQHEPESGVDFVVVGRPPHNPLELLQSPKLRRLIEGARRDYDQVIIDCAPVLAVTDARVASQLADRIILATRWRSTGSDAVGGALRVLADVQAEVAGCVLTVVNMNQYRLYASGEAASYYKRYRRYYVD
jgi:capsular exopolysaccharide synthesis family protein